MSGEQITVKELDSTIKDEPLKANQASKRVNINELLSRVRQEKSKEKKENYIFLSFIFAAVVITGIIASL